jgi:hypothetical protein
MANGSSNKQRLTIQGVDFEIDAPYKEGYALKSNEASAMNQLLAENVRNNLASIVRNAKLKAAGWDDSKIKASKVEQMTPVADGVTLSDDEITDLQSQIDEYVTSYEFGVRTGRARSPFEKAVEDIVTEMLDKALKANGFSPSKMLKEDRSKYDALYTRVLEANKEEVEKAAQARIDTTSGLSIKGIDVFEEAKKTADEIAPPLSAAAE